MAGEGSIAYTDGSKYEGEWVKSQRAGNGRQEWPAGDEYEGVWVADKPHGSGLLKHPDGYARDGDWVEGEPTTTASRVVLAPWTPPPTDLVLSDLVVASPAPGEEAATPAAEGGEGEGERAAAAAAAPDLRSLSLRVSVAGLDDDAAPISATSALVAVDSPMTACAPADALCLALPEGLARPLTLRFALCDAEGVVVAEAAEQVLAHDAADRLVGALTAVGLAAPSDDSKDGGTAVATLHAQYAAEESPPPLDPEDMAAPTDEEAVAAVLAEALPAGGFVPPLAGVCVRAVELAAPPADEVAEEPPPPPPKGKGGKGAEPEPEPAGPTIELYPVACESGRALRVTLSLPDDVAQQRIEAAEAAHAQAVADWEAAQAEAAVAHAEGAAEGAAGEGGGEEEAAAPRGAAARATAARERVGSRDDPHRGRPMARPRPRRARRCAHGSRHPPRERGDAPRLSLHAARARAA